MMRGISVALLLAVCLTAADLVTDGVAAFRQGEYGRAEALLTEAAQQNPRQTSARTFLALSQAANGKCEAALPLLSSLFDTAADEQRKLVGLALVQCHISRSDTVAALPVAVRLQQLYPADADVLYQTARLHMKAFNDATYQMFQKTPGSYRVNQLSGEIFETQGRFAEAIPEYRKALAKNPQAWNLHYRLGRALLLASHGPEALAQARQEFAAELALNPSDAAAEFQLGQLYAAENNRPAAREHYQRALQLHADFPEAALAVAKLHIEAKEYAQAIPLLERVVRQQPSNEAAHYNLMLAYRNAGQLDQAKREKEQLDKLQRPPEGEFTDFLKKLGEKPPQP